ncbi:hypothetical protein AMATHDRAFT_66696, partial [Amanita thiersii Skay4041]
MNSTSPSLELTTILQYGQAIKYADVAGITLLVYDHFLTFYQEATYIWPSGLQPVNALYHYSKYSCFIYIIVTYFRAFTPVALIGKHCRGLTIAAGWLHILGTVSAQGIFAIRAWAIWGQGRNMAICLIVAFAILMGVGFAALQLFVDSVKFRIEPFVNQNIRGCITIDAKAIFCVASWIDLLVFETFLTGILVTRGYQAYKNGGNTGLFNLVYRDGFIFYLIASGITIVTSILVSSLPSGLVLVTLFPVRVIHVTLSSRILLHTRENANGKTHIFDEDGNAFSEVEFWHASERISLRDSQM